MDDIDSEERVGIEVEGGAVATSEGDMGKAQRKQIAAQHELLKSNQLRVCTRSVRVDCFERHPHITHMLLPAMFLIANQLCRRVRHYLLNELKYLKNMSSIAAKGTVCCYFRCIYVLPPL